MREILFRGKRTDNGEWVYGVPTKDTHDETVIVESVFECDEYACRGADCLYVDENTIGQYTGLTDKNGKKIFEGDIVTQPVRETRKHSPCVVEFQDGKFQAHYISQKKFYDRYYDINSYTKVIGNIHDNPELLKGE